MSRDCGQNVDECISNLKIMSSNALFCLQHKDFFILSHREEKELTTTQIFEPLTKDFVVVSVLKLDLWLIGSYKPYTTVAFTRSFYFLVTLQHHNTKNERNLSSTYGSMPTPLVH